MGETGRRAICVISGPTSTSCCSKATLAVEVGWAPLTHGSGSGASISLDSTQSDAKGELDGDDTAGDIGGLQAARGWL